jgi:hypothetical protein
VGTLRTDTHTLYSTAAVLLNPVTGRWQLTDLGGGFPSTVLLQPITAGLEFLSPAVLSPGYALLTPVTGRWALQATITSLDTIYFENDPAISPLLLLTAGIF